MNIVEKLVADLHPYEKNPRRNDDAVKYVAESIKQFGFKVPIVIDEAGVIVAGHTRWKAAKNLGIEAVPCIVADDLSEEQIKAFRLADNKVSEFASWDFELLNTELEELFDFDMADFGFIEQDEIDWDNVEAINEDNYEKPESDKLRCPICGGIDEKIRFKKVNGTETSEEE